MDTTQLLNTVSFIEMGARERAFALLDAGSGRELIGPFERMKSPWLERQGIAAQADDGVVDMDIEHHLVDQLGRPADDAREDRRGLVRLALAARVRRHPDEDQALALDHRIAANLDAADVDGLVVDQ